MHLDGVRWLVDIGYGGGSPARPVRLDQTEPLETITTGERFFIVHETLPGAEATPGELLGWTVQRQFAPSASHPHGLVSPCYFINPVPTRPADIVMAN